MMIDTERLRRVRRWPVGDAAGSVSPDGRLFALGSQAGEVRLLDLRSGRVRRFTGRHDGAVSRDARSRPTGGRSSRREPTGS